ncbi:hypothetical protein C0993_009269, partial [Termitomyces sp. T159_Od127]
LKQIDHAAKRKLLSPEETVGKLKWAQQQLPQLADVAKARVPTTSKVVPQVAPSMDRPARPTAASTGPMLLAVMPVQPTAASTEQLTLLTMPLQPIATSVGQSAVVIPASVALTLPKALEVQKAMDEKMVVVEAGGTVPPLKGTTSQPRCRPLAVSQALEAPEPSKTYQGQKLSLVASQLEIVDFPANILQQAEAAQMLFMKAVVFPASPEQVAVVVVHTNPHAQVQYDGIVFTAVAQKGKHCEALPINDDSNYRELQSEEEEEKEESKMHT